MTESSRLMIVCHDQLHGQCLKEAILTRGPYPYVHVTRDAVDAFERVKTEPTDLVLVDWHLPYGAALDLARWLAGQCPSVRVFLFGLADVAHGEWARNHTGAAGYVLRTETFDDLLTRVRQILVSASSSRREYPRPLDVSRAEPRRPPDANGMAKPEALTVREQQIVHLIEQGMSNKEIARRLAVSLHTVKNHVHNLLVKLDVESRHEAARLYTHR